MDGWKSWFKDWVPVVNKVWMKKKWMNVEHWTLEKGRKQKNSCLTTLSWTILYRKEKNVCIKWTRQKSSSMILGGWMDGCKSRFKDCVPAVNNYNSSCSFGPTQTWFDVTFFNYLFLWFWAILWNRPFVVTSSNETFSFSRSIKDISFFFSFLTEQTDSWMKVNRFNHGQQTWNIN
jgi:hypothetical protein